MPTVNEFTSSLITGQYTPQGYDPTLEIQVALHNQKNYDRVLQTVKGLQSQALNIQMLNQDGRQRLDQYNKELNDSLSGDLGNLNKIEVQNEIAGYFQKIAGDTQLAKASQLSAQYQGQLDMIESFRQSGRKDKGYNSINETVFKEWDGGLYDFMQSDLGKVTDPSFQPTKYTPFKELDTKLLNIAKTLHASTQITEGASGSEGYLVHKEITQVSPEKVRELMVSQFDQEDLEQLDVMAKYEVIQTRKLNAVPEFYQKYNSYADGEIKRTQGQADTLKQQADYYTSLINDKKTPEDKKAQYIQLVNDLTTQSDLYNNRANSLMQSKKEYSDFEKMSNEELLSYSKEMQWFNKISNLSDALSWKKETEIYKPDQVWMFNKKMDVVQWQEQLRAKTKMALAKMSKEGSTKVPEFSGKIDAVKNPMSFVDSYESLSKLQEQFADKSNRIVTSPSFNPQNLLDNAWLQQHKDNYEVKMWDIFSHQSEAVKGNKPQIEAFKLWLKDQEANPNGMISNMVREQETNETISNWLDTKTMEINTATRSKTNEYEFMEGYPMYKSDGSRLSKEEYNAGVPAFIGVPVDKDKSGFKLMDLATAIKEAGEYSDSYTGTNIIPMLPGKRPNSSVVNDQGLYKRLLELRGLKKTNNAQLEQEMLSRLPEIFQMGTVEAMNDEAKAIYYNDVVSAAKNTNNANAQFAISMDDIAFIRPPISGNKGQFALKPNLSEDYGKLGWQLPDAADPTKMIPIVPGGSYSFFTERPYMPYDVLLNEASKDMPIKYTHKGYTINVSRSKMNGTTFVKVVDPKGQVIQQSQDNRIQDVNQLVTTMKQYIDTLKPSK